VKSFRKVTLPDRKGAKRKMVGFARRLLLILYRLLNLSCGRIAPMKVSGLISSAPRVRVQTKSCLIAAREWCWLLMWIAFATVVSAQSVPEIPLGIAWQVKGQWRVDGLTNPVQTGDTIMPGVLLWPIVGSPEHSITILLPDGQRILYECFLAEDCGRGFRVPSLYRKPNPQAGSLLWRIHAALTRTGREPDLTLTNGGPLPRDEAAAILDAQSRVEITGLVSALPDGHYMYTERPFGHTDAPPLHNTIEKKGASITLEIPSPGLYKVIVTDALNTPRVDLLIAAEKEPQAATIQHSFHDAKALLKDWNGDSQGWPIHDFQRAYLESLSLGINPQFVPTVSDMRGRQKNGPGLVGEPVFMPKPGVLLGDTAVTLRCDTPGATIHFTVDNSQPLTSSPVYSAPIMVKRAPLTIKAFATARGKDQSAVVTGTFRIGE
jgi:hypothetical protein